jgi:quercetin dioxygenase-like cupin family protein
MESLNRRQTLLNIAVASVVLPVAPAAAQTPGTPEGREIAPGVRRVDYSKRETMIPNYKTVSMRDNIYQPGASTSGASMGNDMVCHMLEGELTVDTGSGDTLYKKGDVWSCAKNMPERSRNTGSTVAIMRVIDLLPG